MYEIRDNLVDALLRFGKRERERKEKQFKIAK